jgi:hypothetical protein
VVGSCWALRFVDRSFTSHRGDGQWNEERNRKWLEGQHNTNLKKEFTIEQENKAFEVSNPKIPNGLYIMDEYDCKGLILTSQIVDHMVVGIGSSSMLLLSILGKC